MRGVLRLVDEFPRDLIIQNFGLVLEFREFIRGLKLKVGGKGVLQDAIFQDPLVEMNYLSKSTSWSHYIMVVVDLFQFHPLNIGTQAINGEHLTNPE